MYNAEFGKGGGSIINIITKSGSNSIHGSLYEFFRNDVLDARNFFAEEREKLRRNQFGFTLSGPVVKDRAFLFGNYEGFRLREGITRTAMVLSQAQRSGDFSAAPGLLFVGDEGITRSTIQTDKNNFAPRLGFAWDVFGDGRFSVRGGYGIFYDRLIGLLPFQFGLDAPFFPIPGIVPPPSFGDPFLGNSPFDQSAAEVAQSNIFPFFSFLQVMDPDMRTPYVQQWNLDLQWGVRRDLVLEAAYVGTKSTKLPQPVNINSADFIPGESNPGNVDPRRPLAPHFGQISNFQTTALANFHSLQLSANKRFTDGLSFLAAEGDGGEGFQWGRK